MQSLRPNQPNSIARVGINSGNAVLTVNQLRAINLVIKYKGYFVNNYDATMKRIKEEPDFAERFIARHERTCVGLTLCNII